MSRTILKQLPIVALCMVLFSGCARMKVCVEVLNPAFWASPQYVDSVTVTKIVNTQQAILDGQFANSREALKTAVRAELRKMSEGEIPKGHVRPIYSSVVDKVAADFGKLIDQEFAAAQNKLGAAYSKISIVARESSKPRQDVLFMEAYNLYVEGVQILAALGPRLSNEIRKDLSEKIKTDLPDYERWFGRIAQIAAAAEQKGNEITEGLVGKAGILDDPRAAAVVYAPDDYWAGRFNETLCSGSFGNTDCAVKMEGLGNFTIKGVRLDATNITLATFSVGREVIQALAAVYGIPLPKGQAAAGGGAMPPASATDTESPAKREWDATAAIQQMRLARIAIFETIVAQREAIKKDADRPQAVKIIKTVVDANCKLLNP